MANIEVTPDELRSAANRIAQSNDAFRNAATELKAAADELAGTWEGVAHDTFVAEQEQIDNWYKLMAECVDTYVKAMQDAANSYEETDAAGAARIRG